MPKFRRKPGEVEADVWVPGKAVAGVRCDRPGGKGIHYVIDVRGQRHELVPGDVVVLEGIENRAYPVKSAIFAERYEPVEQEG